MRAAWLRTLVTVVVGSVGFASAVANAQESVVFAHPSAGEMGFTGFRGISGGRAVGFWNNPEENRSGSFIL